MKQLLRFLLLLLAAVFFLPTLATILLSFYPDGQVGFSGYDELFFDCFRFYTMFWNSVLYAYVITALQLVVILPAAFAFSFARFKGKEALFFFYIILMMMPLQVMILPNYIGLRDMGILNTRAGIILPMIFSPFGVVVLRQYMKSMDGSVIEAMRLETNSMVRILLHAVAPQVKVCLYAVGLFVFAECWNMLEQPMLLLQDENLKTLTVFFSDTKNVSDQVLYPASVVFMIPILLLYLFFHRELERGLTLHETN
ncbi:MAG: carbohydrate ABC transporter permease [Lachnospiraceae bacterium]|nr:carbohydrate ABC transporter permease [Lachnospiraceae bacterium]